MFRALPPFGGDQRAVAEVVNGLMNGKSNNTGLVTLATGNATTTTIYDSRISADSVILLVPKSAAAYADTAPYGAFQHDADQTASSTTTAYAMALNVTDYSNGIYISNTSRINVRNAGVYNLQFSAQFTNTNSSIHDVDIWLAKNGSTVAGTNGQVSVPNSHGGIDGHTLPAWNYIIELAANDYVELMWATRSTSVYIDYIGTQTSPSRPSTASLIVSMNYVAPAADTNVYVSSQTTGEATLTHFANSTANKTYAYVVIG